MVDEGWWMVPASNSARSSRGELGELGSREDGGSTVSPRAAARCIARAARLVVEGATMTARPPLRLAFGRLLRGKALTGSPYASTARVLYSLMRVAGTRRASLHASIHLIVPSINLI